MPFTAEEDLAIQETLEKAFLHHDHYAVLPQVRRSNAGDIVPFTAEEDRAIQEALENAFLHHERDDSTLITRTDCDQLSPCRPMCNGEGPWLGAPSRSGCMLCQMIYIANGGNGGCEGYEATQ